MKKWGYNPFTKKLDRVPDSTELTHNELSGLQGGNTTERYHLSAPVAPATGLINYIGIAFGETIYAIKSLFDTTNPVMDGTASPGTETVAARRDHVHPSDTIALIPRSILTERGDLLYRGIDCYSSDYLYRKSHTIIGSASGDQTDYQIKLLVYRSTGTDSGNAVYVGTKCLDTYNDIRFTASDGITLLDYWIESSNTALATIWVEVPSIPTVGTTIRMYYGNAGASAVSNGDATFQLFDHFDGTTVNASKWTKSGTVTVSGSIATILRSGADSTLNSIKTFGTNNVTKSLLKSKHFQNTTYRESLFWLGTTGYFGSYFSWSSLTYGKKIDFNNGAASTFLDLTGWTADENHTQELIRNAATSTSVIIDGGTPISNTNRLPSGPGTIQLGAFNAVGSQIDIDYLFVRKYISPEPTDSTWGVEEVYGGIPISPLHHGTAGQPLITKGHGVDPAWGGAMLLSAGSATAGTAPVKFVSGTVMTTPEPGAIEFDGIDYYITI